MQFAVKRISCTSLEGYCFVELQIVLQIVFNSKLHPKESGYILPTERLSELLCFLWNQRTVQLHHLYTLSLLSWEKMWCREMRYEGRIWGHLWGKYTGLPYPSTVLCSLWSINNNMVLLCVCFEKHPCFARLCVCEIEKFVCVCVCVCNMAARTNATPLWTACTRRDCQR